MSKKSETLFIEGPAGSLETIYFPAGCAMRGVAVICHPNPLQGGDYSHKIVQTVAKTLSEQGYHCFCPNFRGVGQSEGEHDYGTGETDDVIAVIEYAQQLFSTDTVILAGFSFGAYVSIFAAQKITVSKLLLIGPAVGIYPIVAPTAFDVSKTFVLHGEEDEIIPLQNVFDWARPQNLPVMVLPGTGHFFHAKLIILKQILLQHFIYTP